MRNKKADPISQAAMDIIEREKQAEEKRKKDLLDCSELGRLEGELLTHKGYQTLATIMLGKKFIEIDKNRAYLKIPGVTSLEQYLKLKGYSWASTWRSMQVAKTFGPQDYSILNGLMPSKADLLSWSHISKQDRNEILHGDKNATLEEIRDALNEKVLEIKKLKDDHAAEKKADARLHQSKQALIDRQSKDLLTLEEENKDLRDKVDGRLPKVDWTEEEKEYNQILSACQMQFMEILATIRKKIPLDKAPPLIITQLYFLYIEMAASAQGERMKLTQYDDGSQPAILDMEESEIPSPEMMIANMPLTAPMADAFNRYKERKLAEAQSRKGAQEREN